MPLDKAGLKPGSSPSLQPAHTGVPAKADAQSHSAGTPAPVNHFILADDHPNWQLLPDALRTRLFDAVAPLSSAAITSKLPDPVVAMIHGAHYMIDVVADQLPLAMRRGQTIGTEIEFMSDVSRTDVARTIAARYQAAGYQTTEVPTTHYQFGDNPNGFWETHHHFTLNNSDYAFHLYEGMGGFVVKAKAPLGIHADILSTTDEAEAFERGCSLLAEKLQLPLDQVRAAALAGSQRYLLALKSEGKDYFQVQIEMKNGQAMLKALTGSFLDADGQPEQCRTIKADSLEAAKDYLIHLVSGRQLPKTDPVTTIQVMVPNRSEPLTIDVRFDVYPIHEVVTSPMTAEEQKRLTAPLLDFLETPGTTHNGTAIHLEGTDGVNQVGFQVHREIPWLNGQGIPTIEYALKLQRDWITAADKIAAVVPTLEARKLFARPLPPIAISEIMNPEFITDPTSVAQALDYFGLIVRTTLPKYHALNLENWFAFYVQELFARGLITKGDIIPSVRYSDVEYAVGEKTVTMSYSQGGDLRYADLVRIPSSHPIPTAELRTPDTSLNPGYMHFLMDFMAGFGHDAVGTASKEVASLYEYIQRPGHEAIARDFARHPGLPLSIFTLLGHGIPELLVAYRLKGLVGEAAMTALAPYKAMASDPVVASVVDSIRSGGLAAVIGPDAAKDPIAHALDNLLKAGADVSKLIGGIYLDGVIPSQHLGVEVEFNTALARDPIYEMIADAYRQIPGATVTLDHGTGDSHFNFNAKSPLHWTISQPIEIGGQTIVAKVASGTGGYIISAIRTIDDAKMRAAHSKDVLGALREAQGLVTEMMGPVAHAQVNTNPHFLMMCKSNDGDYLKIDVVFKEGRATLDALNGSFIGTSGLVRSLQIPAHGPNDVEKFLQTNARAQFAQKDDKIRGLEVRIPGFTEPFKLKLVYEEHPFLEAVTGVVNARTTDVMTPYLDALSSAKIDGNRSGNPLAFQVHAELPYLDAHGKMTIAAFLQLQRNFAALADSFSAVLAPDPNRVDFAKKTPDAYLQRISASNYVDDPTRLVTMLNVLGDFVDARPTKYQDMNADHFASWFLRTLIQQGKLQLGQELTTEWHGQTVKFSVRADADGSPQIFRVIATEGGFTAEQAMIRLSVHQPTVELRLPNALFAPNGGTAGYVDFLTRLTTAFVQTHAQVDSKTVAPGALGSVEGISRLIEVTQAPAHERPVVTSGVQVPASQRGLATVDGMFNVATLGGVAAVEKLATLNTHVTTAATQIAKGGANFLAGDIGSDLVLGNWDRLKALSLSHIAKDYALLTAGGEPTRMAAGSLVSKLPIPTAFKAFATRASSLLGAITAQQYGNTGTVDVAHLPESVASIMTASALVQGSAMVMGQVETLSNLGKVLRLAKVGGGATGWGLVVTSVAEFALIKTFGKIMEEADEAQRLTALTDSVGTILTTASAIPTALAQGQAIKPNTISAVQGQLDEVIAALEQSLTLDERRVWAAYQQNSADLKDWHKAKMAKPLDGTFSYGEIEDTYRTRQTALAKTRDQDLAALAVQNPHFTRLPVDPADDWNILVDAIDEDQLKADVDMDGNPNHNDSTPLRYQALLDRNPHVLAAQLKQFRADWEASLKRRARPMPEPGFQQILAQL